MKPVIVLSLGAGVQSSTLALMAEAGLAPKPDFAVFADTGCEPTRVYKWLRELTKHLSFPVLVAKRQKAGTLYDNIFEWGQSQIPAWVRGKDGHASPGRQQCTRYWKVRPVNSMIRATMGAKGKKLPPRSVGVLKGISTDEVSRVKPDPEPWVDARFPLVDMGLDRHYCVEWLQSRGLEAPKSACFFCPWRSNGQWRDTLESDRHQWNKAVELDRELNKTGQYLHKSLIPLDKVQLDEPDPQLTLWNNDCVGVCGV